MILSKSKKILFIHIQKTGGCSVRSLLRRQCGGFKHYLDLHGHALHALEDLGQEAFDACYKFAFVRNPWDRMVSWYKMLKFRRDKRCDVKNKAFEKGDSFEAFIRHVPGITNRPSGPRSCAFDQMTYIGDADGRLLVNDVYRFEDFEAECRRLAARIGFEIQDIPHKNRAKKHRHYSTYYTDELAEVAAKRLARDISAFGYKFERK